MFNHYRLPKNIGLSPSSKYWAQHPGYNRSASKIDGKNYVCDFLPLQNCDDPQFYQKLNEALALLSNRPNINVPIVPISFWTLISVGDPTPAHLLIFYENSDNKLTLDELENPPSKSQSPVILNPLEKAKVAFTVQKTCQYVSTVETVSSQYLSLTERCVFFNQNREPSLGYYGLHLLKDYLTPECYSKFFNEEQVSIDPKFPPYFKSYGKIHWFIENIGEQTQIPFEQCVFSNMLKKTTVFDKPQPKNAAILYITSCFDPKTRTPLTYKGCKIKEFAPFAAEITKSVESPRVDIDPIQKYKVSPDPSTVSQNNIFTKFMSSFMIPYPDDEFRRYVGESLQQYFSSIFVQYAADYSFTVHLAKRGPRFYQNNAFAESQGLSNLSQEFIDQLKKASVLGSVEALFKIAHFALLKYDSEPPEELLEILKTAGDAENNCANIDYGIFLAMKSYLENYNPESDIKSEVVQNGLDYLEKASQSCPISLVLIAFFCYICNDKEKAVLYLQKAERGLPSVTPYIKLLSPA